MGQNIGAFADLTLSNDLNFFLPANKTKGVNFIAFIGVSFVPLISNSFKINHRISMNSHSLLLSIDGGNNAYCSSSLSPLHNFLPAEESRNFPLET